MERDVGEEGAQSIMRPTLYVVAVLVLEYSLGRGAGGVPTGQKWGKGVLSFPIPTMGCLGAARPRRAPVQGRLPKARGSKGPFATGSAADGAEEIGGARGIGLGDRDADAEEMPV